MAKSNCQRVVLPLRTEGRCFSDDESVRAFLLIMLFLLSGCASQAPASIRSAAVSEVTVAQVREGDAQRYFGTEVRWGGSIAKVENGASQTLIQMVSRPLGKDGRPKPVGDGGGRFVAKFQGFLDPLIYDKGRPLTIIGTLHGQLTRSIGEYVYTFPVVEVESHYLWDDTGRCRCQGTEGWPCDYYPYPYSRYPWPSSPYYW